MATPFTLALHAHREKHTSKLHCRTCYRAKFPRPTGGADEAPCTCLFCEEDCVRGQDLQCSGCNRWQHKPAETENTNNVGGNAHGEEGARANEGDEGDEEDAGGGGALGGEGQQANNDNNNGPTPRRAVCVKSIPAHMQLSENIGGGRWLCSVCITDIIQDTAEDICAISPRTELVEDTTVRGGAHDDSGREAEDGRSNMDNRALLTTGDDGDDGGGGDIRPLPCSGDNET